MSADAQKTKEFTARSPSGGRLPLWNQAGRGRRRPGGDRILKFPEQSPFVCQQPHESHQLFIQVRQT